jgi:hypothetical protein
MKLVDGREVPMSAEEESEREAEELAWSEQQTKIAPLNAIQGIEQKNPITHRALRELILTIGEAFPAGKNTVFYQRVLQTELAIQVERAKL